MTSLNLDDQGQHGHGAYCVVVADLDIDPDTARQILQPLRAEVVFERRDWAGQGVVGVVMNSESRIQPALADLVRCPDMRIVVTTTTGLDHIDVAACRLRGVSVWHPTDYCSDEVADTAIALLLGLLRGTVLLDRDVCSGGAATKARRHPLGHPRLRRHRTQGRQPRPGARDASRRPRPSGRARRVQDRWCKTRRIGRPIPDQHGHNIPDQHGHKHPCATHG